MLSPETIRKIKKIHIKTGRMVNTMMAGQYRSVFRGTGIEFEEVRDYSPGDDVKHIDWKVSARLGRPFIKLYREEREMVVMLLIDMSASQRFGTTDNLKLEVAAEIAAVLAFNAIRNNDRVGVILFTDRVEKYIPPKKGSAHIWRVTKEIFTFEPQHRRTDIDAAVAYLGKVSKKKTVSFVISDFLNSGFEKQMRKASRRHELIGVLISDPGDFMLPPGGIVAVEDFETGEQVCLDAFDPGTREAYARHNRRRHYQTLERFRRSNLDCIEFQTDTPVVNALTRYFHYRENRLK
jgi:uncharacterized protein (DUF58 family)